MRDDIESSLMDCGLSGKEVAVFIHLVENGRTTAYRIAKGTRLCKSTCYDVLDRLVEKGFVAQSAVGGRKLYSARDMREVLGMVKAKEALVASLIPKVDALTAQEDTSLNHVRSKGAFQGVDVKIAELARQGQLSYVYMIGNNPEISTRGSTILTKRLLRQLEKERMEVDCRGIWDPQFRTSEFMQQFTSLGANRFLSVPSSVTTFIFNGHVVFFFLDDVPNVVELKNKKISDEMKAYFLMMWDLAE
ncbi:MAG: TrmB family transcriptional regulator [Nanoarchaeota archaeon]